MSQAIQTKSSLLKPKMKTTHEIQCEQLHAVFAIAAEKLEEIASEVRTMAGVATAGVWLPSIDEISDALDEGDIFVPTLTVEAYRGSGSAASSLDHSYPLSRCGDGNGQYGPLWVYVATAKAEGSK
jgi:hypothetical protein